MINFWEKLEMPFFVMAPMAGITDQPFRLMCKKYGADVLYSEMISSEALFHNASKFKIKNAKLKINESQSDNLYKTLKLIQFSKAERPYVVQIFGSNPEHMSFAAEYIASGKWFTDYEKIQNVKRKMQNNNIKCKNFDFENLLKIKNPKLKIEVIPDGIDINMGCPAKDVVKTGAGVALMKNQDLAIKIIKAIKKRVKNIPISVKTRIGWDNSDGLINFTKRLEKAGVNAIAIHGRTYKQGFVGKVDWEMIQKVKKILKIPVIGNGGIDKNFKFEILNLKLDLDGYMIGRGALGKPWLFRKLKNQSEKCKINESLHGNYTSKRELAEIILEHAKLVDKYKGDWGIREFRKHFAWYLKGIKDCRKLRYKAVEVENIEDVKSVLTRLI